MVSMPGSESASGVYIACAVQRRKQNTVNQQSPKDVGCCVPPLRKPRNPEETYTMVGGDAIPCFVFAFFFPCAPALLVPACGFPLWHKVSPPPPSLASRCCSPVDPGLHCLHCPPVSALPPDSFTFLSIGTLIHTQDCCCPRAAYVFHLHHCTLYGRGGISGRGASGYGGRSMQKAVLCSLSKTKYDQWERAPGPGRLQVGCPALVSVFLCLAVLRCQAWSSTGTRAKARSGVGDGSCPWPAGSQAPL